MATGNFPVIGTATLAVILGYIVWKYADHQPAALPPGPRGLPILGNALQIPKDFPEHQFAKWGEEYGDIMSITALGQPIIILNSSRAAIALLEQKSLITSDRPIFIFGGEMVGWGQQMPFLQYGQPWKDLRKVMHQGIGTKGNMEKEGYTRHTEEGAGRFLKRVLDRSEQGDIGALIRKSFGGFVLKMSFGYEIQEEGEDHFIQIQEHLLNQINEFTAPGAFMVDLFPFLRYVPSWMPGAGFQRKAQEWKVILEEIVQEPHTFVKQHMAAGTAMPSFTANRLTEKNLSYKEEQDVRKAIATIYGAGVDTTSAAIHTFFLIMSLYPDVQKRAHAEIDVYLLAEGDRLPGIADRESLPYLDAIMKEVLRWNPVGALGVPHRMHQDDLHEGYFLPKGSIIFQNIWKILHDPQTYKNPMDFNPERFLVSPERAIPEEDPRHAAFGYGRRTCPGATLADASVFVFGAMSLAVFDISHGGVGKGFGKMSLEALRENVAFEAGIVSAPKPFDCIIKPRSSKAEALIRAVNEGR